MGLNRLDLAIIAIYLIGITLFGLRFRKRQRTLRDYFLAGRDIPWWAIALSIVAAETSTLTIVSMPGLAYDTNMTFLQVAMGYIVGRLIISFLLLLIPLFDTVPPSAWKEGVAFSPILTVAPAGAGVATVVVLLVDASATASSFAWRAPDVRSDSPAKAADAFPIDATSANTSNRFMPFLLIVSRIWVVLRTEALL